MAMVFTLGHSNHPLETFLELLQRNEIQMMVDVRSSPYSKYASQFNREVIENQLRTIEVGYQFSGDSLGGMPQSDEFYDADGYVLYGRIAESVVFQSVLDRLSELLESKRVALVCGEEDPTNCHRRLLLGRVLKERGHSVLHLRGDGRIESEEELLKQQEFEKTKGQRSLFDLEEPEEWKSTQSVSLRKTHRSSSEYSEDGPYDD